MSFSATVGVTFASSEGTISTAKRVEADTKLVQALAVPDESTNLEVPVGITVANVKAVILSSDQDVTLKFNSSSVPDPEIALKAGVPYVWHEEMYDSLLLDSDITSVFITNASGAVANVLIRALIEATEYA